MGGERFGIFGSGGLVGMVVDGDDLTVVALSSSFGRLERVEVDCSDGFGVLSSVVCGGSGQGGR